MYVDAARYSAGIFTNPGPRVCDYVDDGTLNVRKSAAEVGAASYASYESSLADLIYNNNIACSMMEPS